jgi:hypothetical protein
MKNKSIAVVAALLFGATTAHAQALAVYGGAELAGFGEGSALLGGTLSTGRQGLGPIVSAQAQAYRYQSGPGAHNTAVAVSPAVGLQWLMSEGLVQASVGYTFADDNVGALLSPGGEFGGKSTFVSGQINHWGNGDHQLQWIGNYAFKPEYYWTRGRASTRVIDAPNPIFLGAEAVFQGYVRTNSYNTSTIGGTPAILTRPSWRFQVGPTLEYRITNDFRVGASAGYRGGPGGSPASAYGRVEFLSLSRF